MTPLGGEISRTLHCLALRSVNVRPVGVLGAGKNLGGPVEPLEALFSQVLGPVTVVPYGWTTYVSASCPLCSESSRDEVRSAKCGPWRYR